MSIISFKSILILVLFLGLMAPQTQYGWGIVGPAMADDDDDDGGGDDGDDEDDDDDDDDSRGGSGGGNGSVERGGGSQNEPRRTRVRSNSRASTAARQAPRPAAPLPLFAANEIVTLGLSEADLAQLLALNFTLIEQRDLPGLSVATAQRLAIPAPLSLTDARALVRTLPSGQSADFNHYYRTEQADPETAKPVVFQAPCEGPHCGLRDLVNWPQSFATIDNCLGDVTLGIIDTGLNEDHETFADADLTVHRLTLDKMDSSRAIHGTAVAALLIGAPDSRSPGLLPGVKTVAVDAFHRVGPDERADVFSLIDGLSYMVEQDVDVINLSFAGPPNEVLEQVVTEVSDVHGIVLVASAGNAGPRSAPLFPAAYAPVITTTAVDRGNAVYRRAVQGPHIDVAAPGVEVWTAASVKGARWKTGTSFAAPFVSAAALLLLSQRPDLTYQDVSAILKETATDLGQAGRDDTFGYGLMSLAGICE